MKTIKINFRTTTPLWTGDAWGNNVEIRPSSIIGGLRFWFGIICYFAGVTDNSDYENGKLKDDLKSDEFKEKLLKYGANFEGLDKALADCNISLPSRVFGCTGWKGWVRVKYVKFEKGNFKKELVRKIIRGKNWFWGTTYYDGTFTISFEIEGNILEPIFYPILKFVEKYGFLGGKWNIGYGRIKVENIDDNLWNNKFANENDDEIEFKFNENSSKKISEIVEIKNGFSASTQSYDFLKFILGVDSFYCSKERDFQDKISHLPCDVRIIKLDDNFSDFKDAVQKLLKIKAKMRNCLRPDSSMSRHELLGTTSGGLEGTKIIPWIYKENGQIKGGFVSIAGILNLGGKDNG